MTVSFCFVSRSANPQVRISYLHMYESLGLDVYSGLDTKNILRCPTSLRQFVSVVGTDEPDRPVHGVSDEGSNYTVFPRYGEG